MPHYRVLHAIVCMALIGAFLTALASCKRERDLSLGASPDQTHRASATTLGGASKHSGTPVVASDDAPRKRDLGSGAGGETLPSQGRQPVVFPMPTWQKAELRTEDRAAGFHPTAQNDHTSTFGLDADSGSWDRARRQLAAGNRIEPSTIRVEEFVNAFRYRYVTPEDAPLGFDIALAPCPWNDAHLLLRVGVQGSEPVPGERQPCNLVLLVDVSGSMSPADRLPLLQRCFHLLVDRLDDRDRIAIVTYANHSGIALPSTSVRDQARIHRAIDALSASGGTNGGDGLRTAYRLARDNFRAGGQNRVLLATDGDFNVGTTDEDELVRLTREQACDPRGGIFLTVLGVGDSTGGDRRMEQLADRCDGVYAGITDVEDGRRVLCERLASTLITVAKDAKAQVFFNPSQVAGWRLIGYENRLLARTDFNNDRIDGGEVGAGHQVTALYELIPAATADANPFDADESAAGSAVSPSKTIGPIARARLRYQLTSGGESRLIETDISARVASLDSETGFAAAMAAFALKLRGHACVTRMGYAEIAELARRCRGVDSDGRRSEAVGLIRARER